MTTPNPVLAGLPFGAPSTLQQQSIPTVPIPADLCDREEVHVTHLDIPSIAYKTWEKILDRNDPPRLFRRDNKLVRLEEKGNGVRLASMDRDRMRGFMARSCFFTNAWSGKTRVVDPPDSVVRDMLVNINSQIPILERIVTAPFFANRETLIDTSGYHERYEVYYDKSPDLFIDPIPDHPTSDDLAAARKIIDDDLLVDFILSDTDRAHAYALAMEPFVQRIIDAATPLYNINAATIGAGKGKLFTCLMMASAGTAHSMLTAPQDEAEWRKQLAATLSEGPSVVCIDNVSGLLTSSALASILTERKFNQRIIGYKDNTDITSNGVTWAMTANNPMVSNEIARRSISIRIGVDQPKPYLRTNFKHADITTWAKENRHQLVWAWLTMIRYAFQNWNPHTGNSPGSYEQWASVMGGILNSIGVKGFLGNIEEMYNVVTADESAWTEFVTVWYNSHENKKVTAAELLPLIKDNQIEIDLDDKNPSKSLGAKIGTYRDIITPIDHDGYRKNLKVVKTDRGNRAAHWSLELIGDPVKLPDESEEKKSVPDQPAPQSRTTDDTKPTPIGKIEPQKVAVSASEVQELMDRGMTKDDALKVAIKANHNGHSHIDLDATVEYYSNIDDI